MTASIANRIDLSKLKWIKVVTDPDGWAYTRDRLKHMPNTVDFNDATVFPLGFKNNQARKPEPLDQMALIQKGKLTHVVEVLDNAAYEGGGWHHRMCRIVWWKPEVDNWKTLQPQSDLLGFTPSLMDGNPHIISKLTNFKNRWAENGELPGFRAYLESRL